MKRKALLEFADKLAHSRRPFDMQNAQQCVTAYAVLLMDGPPGGVVRESITYFAEKFGVSHDIAHDINGGNGLSWDEMEWVTRKQAVAMLRRLARTGEVKFDKPTIPESVTRMTHRLAKM